MVPENRGKKKGPAYDAPSQPYRKRVTFLHILHQASRHFAQLAHVVARNAARRNGQQVRQGMAGAGGAGRLHY